MRLSQALLTFGLGLCLASCASLETAPLVYVSAQDVGVKVSAGQPDRPGAYINIGYALLDAAYVPVAVAKHCKQGGKLDCSLKQINGSSTEINGGSPTDSVKDEQEILDRESAVLNQLRSQEQALKRRKDESDSGLAQSKCLNDLLVNKRASAAAAAAAATSTAAGTAPVNAPANVPVQIDASCAKSPYANSSEAQLEDALKAIPAAMSAEQYDSEVQQIHDAKEVSIKRSRDAQAAVDQLRAGVAPARQDIGRDSYSVYGSFTGKTGAATAAAGLNANLDLGKVFSTGIAAQHLTKGIGAAALANSRAQCLTVALDAAEKQSTEAKKLAARDQVNQLCGDPQQ